MSVRIAIASRDNIFVHQHFGRATHFQIYDLHDKGFVFVETRENIPSCGSNEIEADAHSSVVNLLKDCSAVVVARIGPGAIETLNTYGLKYYMFPGSINTALQKIITLNEQS
jgi:nitrogen fixation protein NifB